MIDLHCHLAYGVDDGPHNEAESLDLARALVDAGITDVACTSHLRRDKVWVNDRGVQEVIHRNLNRILGEADVSLKRYCGAEHYIDDLLLETCLLKQVVPYAPTQELHEYESGFIPHQDHKWNFHKGNPITGNDLDAANKWLLIELPYAGPPPDLFGFLHRIRQTGYKILLAHLERFPYVVDHPQLVERMVDSGYAIQINLGSLSGAYHRHHKKAARWLLDEGFVHIAAGDCHRWKDVKKCIIKGRYALEKLAGPDELERLTITNPQRILDDCGFEALEE